MCERDHCLRINCFNVFLVNSFEFTCICVCGTLEYCGKSIARKRRRNAETTQKYTTVVYKSAMRDVVCNYTNSSLASSLTRGKKEMGNAKIFLH